VLGEQHLLYLACPFEFFFLLLQRNGSFLNGLLQQLVALFQFSLQFFGAETYNVGDDHDDDAEIPDLGEEKRERLGIDFGQLQEEYRAHGADQPESELDREKCDPVPREWPPHVQSAAGEGERNEQVAYR
jgi:hypothetical protein